MELFKSGNPTLSEKAFQNATVINSSETMTAKGAMNKFGFMFLLVMAASVFSWNYFYEGNNPMPLVWTGIIGGFILALVIIFKKEWSPYLAPAYALLEGLALGAISAVFDYAFQNSYPHIIMHAIGLTFGVAISMYMLYSMKLIRATERFKSIIFVATAGIAVFYLITMVVRLFGVNIPFMYDASPLGIGISLFIVAIAALNLIIDFDMIEQGAAKGAPKYFEWYCAFGLMVTIVWLYLEILRLLSRFARK